MTHPEPPPNRDGFDAGSFPALQPLDSDNGRLRDHVHPADWPVPEPAPRYNLVVLGGGTAGLVAAAGAAGLGARVALVERHLLGGDCLNVGCVPSKALLRSARAAAAVRGAADFGVQVDGPVRVDFPAVMARLRRLRADLAPHDSAARFRALGVDVFLGHGRFTGRDTVEVSGRTLRFAKAVIATGGRPAAPDIPGLASLPFLTHETLFSLDALPRRFGVLGGGPIGCEMAQAFARFGSEVTLIESGPRILARDDDQGAAVVHAALVRDGVRLQTGARVTRVDRTPDGLRLHLEGAGTTSVVTLDQLLVATGRAPNLENLGLDAAGVEADPRGIRVDDRLRTANPRIFACGDVCSPHRFTHAADAMARVVLRNALFGGRARVGALRIPWCTYTSPELAHVGHHAESAAAAGLEIETFVQELQGVDRAVLDGETGGFVKVHVRRGSDRIVGATVVAEHAGETISELTLAMNAGLGLGALSATLHPYPTQADAIRRAGDQYQRTRLTPGVRRAFETWLRWQRR